jgi:hypothetical protein
MTRTRTMRPLPLRMTRRQAAKVLGVDEKTVRNDTAESAEKVRTIEQTTPELAPWPDRWLYDHGLRDDRELPPDEVEP